MTTKQKINTSHELNDSESTSKRVFVGQHCIKKLVIYGDIIRLGQKIISPAELRELADKEELVVLGLVAATGELIWESAPSWDFLAGIESITMYHVADPARRIEKRFKALPVNTILPYFSVEFESNISTEIREDLEAFKAELQPDLDLYFELSDKSGDIMRRGTCRLSFLDKLKHWAEDIGGSFYTEAIC